MGAGHAHPLHLPGVSPVHRLAPQVKVLAAFLLVCCVVATPREAFWAFGAYFLLLCAVWVVAAIPPGWIAARSLIEAPVVLVCPPAAVTGVPSAAASASSAATSSELVGRATPSGTMTRPDASAA